MGSGEYDFALESVYLETVLNEIRALRPSEIGSGTLVFASSAGGIYGSGLSGSYDESSNPFPFGAYGTHKLDSETRLSEFVESYGLRVANCRLANVYGPRQDLRKNQGLISTIVKACIENRPVSIYVPLDTTRNFIHVDDAASKMVAFANKLRLSRLNLATKIICSSQNVNIATILRECKLVLGRRVIFSASNGVENSKSPRNIRLSSAVFPSIDTVAERHLAVGIDEIRYELLKRL
jgi:UDP-glucose 4-epimerase